MTATTTPPSAETALHILVNKLIHEVAHLAAAQLPWVTTTEMCQRYNVTPKTLTAMELRGDIPARHKGRWNRAELLTWEARKPS